MNCDGLLYRDIKSDPGFPDTSVNRYAWLEYERGAWHFLTHLFADAGESTRRWTNKQCALDELIGEGWAIVGSYPESGSTPSPTCGGATGFGLIWMGR